MKRAEDCIKCCLFNIVLPTEADTLLLSTPYDMNSCLTVVLQQVWL